MHWNPAGLMLEKLIHGGLHHLFSINLALWTMLGLCSVWDIPLEANLMQEEAWSTKLRRGMVVCSQSTRLVDNATVLWGETTISGIGWAPPVNRQENGLSCERGRIFTQRIFMYSRCGVPRDFVFLHRSGRFIEYDNHQTTFMYWNSNMPWFLPTKLHAGM